VEIQVGASELKRAKELEAQNTTFKIMYTDIALENNAMKDIFRKNLNLEPNTTIPNLL